MNKRTRGILFVVLGAVLILSGVGLHLIRQQQDTMAGQNSALLLEALNHEIVFNDSFGLESPPPSTSPEPEVSLPPIPSRAPTETSPPSEPAEPESSPSVQDAPMPIRTLAGYDLIGILRVPSQGLELPILNDWSYSLLNIAPCRYSGSLEQNNLILLGHNFRSHLASLAHVKPGDAVEFVDIHGTVHRFLVDTVATIRGTDVEALESDHPLILFTCTQDSAHRIVVRCTSV